MTIDTPSKRRILWGVCGIGYGHIYRQFPLIEHFAQDNTIVIFGYGESFRFYSHYFSQHPNVTVTQVAVPYYPGNAQGIDFEATANKLENKDHHATINARAMAEAWKFIRRPTLVVSDYEPISAQYAYACDSPLVTIDQQSKYLIGEFLPSLNGRTFNDEQMRLRMFFPKAEERIACSFFNVVEKEILCETVRICPPVLGQKIVDMERRPSPFHKSILIYLSPQQTGHEIFIEMDAVCAAHPEFTFYLFAKDIESIKSSNIICYKPGDPRFLEVLATCHGIVTTAGHGLLSEAMHLGIPVYALPLPLYEQEMNAHVIESNHFGKSGTKFSKTDLNYYISHLLFFSDTIQRDKDILLRRPGQSQIIPRLEHYLT